MSLRHSMLAILVILLWGMNVVVIDEGMSDVPPLLFLALRFTLVALPWVFLVPRPEVSWRLVVAVGAFMSLGQFSLLYVALDLGLPAGLASLLLQAQVIFTIVLAAGLLGEMPTRRQAVGVLVGAGGLAFVVVAHGVSAPIIPVLVMLGATLSWAAGNVIVRSAGTASGLSLVVWSALVVPIPAGLASVVLDGRQEVGDALINLSGTAVASTVYAAVGSSIIGYGIWNSLLARYPASAVVPFALLMPVVGIVTAWVVQDEVPLVLETVGGVVMLAGVAVATAGRGRGSDDTVDVPRRGRRLPATTTSRRSSR
ncbi:EamA family transporter [Aeromicrobium endophyticum]|uniref:EamA family transporter n=1 Tax=Aeromicrobium endophyticum TaxID=2292704 RepID=A0A371NYX3_9ACTN|nr:EamA family transporter [Aeromicrobium endophyticum]REK68894.1 EamA family transporter [Aeromicrobium endophyticum]